MGDSSRREFLKASAGVLGVRFIDPRPMVEGGDVLYNGIRLADPWPPRNRVLDDVLRDPPYVRDPPAVIPIDIGRQLFVDDFLIEDRTLSREFHRARYHPRNPVLQPATQWEMRDEYADRTRTPSNPAAMVFSDGVFYDPADRIYKMWYMGGYQQHTCLALSHDGLVWERPSLDVTRGTNIVYTDLRDSSTIWLDLDATSPASRFKMTSFNGSENAILLFESSDGIHWRRVGRTGATGDRSTAFWNPFRRVWVFSLRADRLGGTGRFRQYWETRHFASAHWREEEPVPWVRADALDPRRPELGAPAELYSLDCVAYESVILGLFTIFRGERNDREKPNDICVGFSRDGFHWSRPDRRPFIGVSEKVGDWNWANVQSAGGGCLIVGDQLYFYVSGRRGVPGTNLPGICSTGLATLRRDGFASLTDVNDGRAVRAASIVSPAGSVTTRPLRFSGRHLFVNADVSGGELRAEVLDRDGRPIASLSRERCVPVAGDATRREVSWQGTANLGELRGETIRLRFYVTRGRLFSFWVTDSPSGASHGYAAAGGPGFTRSTDD